MLFVYYKKIQLIEGSSSARYKSLCKSPALIPGKSGRDDVQKLGVAELVASVCSRTKLIQTWVMVCLFQKIWSFWCGNCLKLHMFIMNWPINNLILITDKNMKKVQSQPIDSPFYKATVASQWNHRRLNKRWWTYGGFNFMYGSLHRDS